MKIPVIQPLIFADDSSLQAYELVRLRQFIFEANDDIKQLNGLIRNHNQTRDEKKQITLLNQIYQTQEHMRSKYPPTLTSQCPNYEQIYQELSGNIRAALQSHGVHSLPPIFSAAKDQPALAKTLSNMPPEKINRMMEIIVKGIAAASEDHPWEASELSSLYAEGEPGQEEFNAFLSSHQCRVISTGNSINLQLVDENSNNYLLRIEVNRDTAPQLELMIREKSIATHLTTVFSKKSGSFPGPHRITSGTLWLGEWCERGNLLADSARHLNDETKVRAAIDIYSQMSHALQDIEAQGCSFPDMKNENWLLTRDQTLRISDAKSFAHTVKGNMVYFDFESKRKSPSNEGNVQNRWHEFLESRHMRPPEFQRKKIEGSWDPPVKAGLAHSYMLGKNLYQYLTGCDNAYLQSQKSYETLDFSASIFATEKGRELKSVITNLFRTDPDTRMTIERTTQLLEGMKSPQQRECQQILKEIEQKCSVGNDDNSLHAYVARMQRAISTAASENNIEMFREIKAELNHTLTTVAPVTQEMNKLLYSLRDRQSGLLSRGNIDKAALVERAIGNVPLSERRTITSGHSAEAREVLQLMAMQRTSGKTACLADGSIDEAKAAKTLGQFKESMSVLRAAHPSTTQGHEEGQDLPDNSKNVI